MRMPQRVSDYLRDADIRYQLINHHHTNSSVGTAVAAEIPYPQIAKAVILLDHEDRKLMAVLPANHKISLPKLSDQLNHSYHLAKEQKVYQWFIDCENGAVPPLANAYHMDVIYDDSLLNNHHVYLESGNHETLIKLEIEAFKQLMANAKHDRFSHEFIH